MPRYCVLALVIALSIGVQAVIPGGVISHWPGNGNAHDVTGPNTASVVGTVGYAPGWFNEAFSLSGAGYLNAGNDPSLWVSTSSFTITAWVTIAAPGGDMSIVDKMSGSNYDGWRLIKQADGRIWFCFGGGPGVNKCYLNSHTIFSDSVLSTNRWYHIAITKTPSEFRMYIDGALQTSSGVRTVPSFYDTNSNSLLIGAMITAGAYFNGRIDEVLLFNRALSASEVSENTILPTVSPAARAQCDEIRDRCDATDCGAFHSSCVGNPGSVFCDIEAACINMLASCNRVADECYASLDQCAA